MVNSFNPQYVLQGQGNLPYVHALKQAYDETMQGQHKLSEFVQSIEGMSGNLYRKTINNLVGKIPNAKYLEVGSWKGSTLCAAVYGNDVDAFCIDNWTEFNADGTVRAQFLDNIDKTGSERITVVEQDFMTVDFSKIGKYNVYMFDGPHEEKDQYNGVMIAQPALDDVYVLIVDDWNWNRVRRGTINALLELKSKILFSLEVRTSLDDSHADWWGTYSLWHNGIFIAVIQK